MTAAIVGLPGTGRSAARLVLALVVSACLGLAAWAANFPPLTGRIVDQAKIIPRETREALETKLADLEAKSGIQLVVATVMSLDGQEIEPYAIELFRYWKLGEEAKNNVALLLVAPHELALPRGLRGLHRPAHRLANVPLDRLCGSAGPNGRIARRRRFLGRR